MVRYGPPRSPLPPSACSRHTPFAVRVEALPPVAPRFARDRPFRACGEHTRRSGLKCMCPRRQRFSRVGPGLPKASGTLRPATDMVASRAKRGMRWPLAPGGSLEDSLCSSSKPCLAARRSRCSPLASPWPPFGRPRSARQDGARGWLWHVPRALSLAPRWGAREGASESAETVLSVVIVENRDVRASRW